MTHILLGVSGSISAYKAPEIVRLFKKEGWDVTPILTAAATQFVSPLSLSTVAETPTLTPGTFMDPEIPHLKAAKSGDIFVCAPVSANTLSKFRVGSADDPVSAVVSAFSGPIILAPAMHTEMWEHPPLQENIQIFKDKGYLIVGPDRGELASGDTGTGRLVDPRLLVLAVKVALSGQKRLDGQKIVISSGGTVEPIDSVRVLSNLSSGQSGETLAHIASLLGAEVTLITTKPLQIPNPHIAHVIPVQRAADLKIALEKTVPGSDALYMAAAVSDFTVETANEKISRDGNITLDLQKTDDILKALAPLKGQTRFLGYCLADGNLEETAKQKLVEKGLDFIVANTSDQIGQNKRTVTVYSAKGTKKSLKEVSLSTLSLALLSL